MKLYLPANLDVAALLKEHPPTTIENFKTDRLIYIISLVISIPAINKDLIIKNGFTPINAEMLQRKFRNYDKYINFLLSHNIFITDNHCINGKKSRGYKYSPMYEAAGIKSATIHDSHLIKSINKHCDIPAAKAKKYKHLLFWYNSKLTIDYNTAVAFLEADLNRKLLNPSLRDLDKEDKPKDPYLQHKCALHNLEMIKERNFNLSIDDNVKRLHSTISNFRSTLRNCISFGGRKLLSIDVKNSQPYLSTVLLNILFWREGKLGENCTILDINKFYDNKFKNIFNDTDNKLYSFVTLVNSYVKQAGSDLHRYITLVQQGKFYAYLGEEFTKILELDYTDKKHLKPIVFQVFFSASTYLHQAKAKHKRIFKDLFPDLYEIFSLIKKSDKANLPRLLQRIESHLILNVITKRIARERKNLPIFTIHDSIVTTDEGDNGAYIRKVMEEEFIKAIGFPPKFEVEHWDIANLAFNDKTPFNKEVRIAV
jgi:hypothetical protein